MISAGWGEVKITYSEAEGSTSPRPSLGHTGHLVNSTAEVFLTEYALFGCSGSLEPPPRWSVSTSQEKCLPQSNSGFPPKC